MKIETDQDLYLYIISLGDDRIIAGHRLSEWCGRAPILEEDIALANIALDLLGQGSAFLEYSAEREGQRPDADFLTFFRDPPQFQNLCFLEEPDRDFAVTIMRHYLFGLFSRTLFEELAQMKLGAVSEIAAKCVKEVTYHVRHTAQWVLRLGDGTDESHQRAQRALDELWPKSSELFEPPPYEMRLVAEGIIPDIRELRSDWQVAAEDLFHTATLRIPTQAAEQICSGRVGQHSAHLTTLLTTMQSLARAHPGAKW